jgi:hypothetical protein
MHFVVIMWRLLLQECGSVGGIKGLEGMDLSG